MSETLETQPQTENLHNRPFDTEVFRSTFNAYVRRFYTLSADLVILACSPLVAYAIAMYLEMIKVGSCILASVDTCSRVCGNLATQDLGIHTPTGLSQSLQVTSHSLEENYTWVGRPLGLSQLGDKPKVFMRCLMTTKAKVLIYFHRNAGMQRLW